MFPHEPPGFISLKIVIWSSQNRKRIVFLRMRVCCLFKCSVGETRPGLQNPTQVPFATFTPLVQKTQHDPGWFLLAFFKLKLLPKGPLTTLTHITTYIILIKLRLIHKRDSNLFSLINNSKLEGNHKDRYTFTLSKHIARITPTIR